MGKIGFRIRSKVNKQVSIYVYLYGPFKTRLEAKTGFVVLRDEWDIKKMRARISDENGVRLNGYLDQLERHLLVFLVLTYYTSVCQGISLYEIIHLSQLYLFW